MTNKEKAKAAITYFGTHSFLTAVHITDLFEYIEQLEEEAPSILDHDGDHAPDHDNRII